MLLWNSFLKKNYRTVLTLHKNYLKAKHLEPDITFLRHGQSNYNVESTKYLNENKIINLSWDEICQIQDFNLDINFNRKFIDCDLSDHGAVQCYELKKFYEQNKFDYDLVLVSPMLRALRTCHYIFYYFPIKKIVLPQLTQAFRYSCDISKDIEEKRQQFKQIDFSLIQPGDNNWFLDTQPKQTSQRIIKTIQDKQLQTYEQIQQQMLMMMYEGKIYQSDYHLRLRAQKVKRIIQSYKKKYPKIVIISHHYVIQNLLAQGYRSNHLPITSLIDEVPNATPIKIPFKQMLSVK